MPTSSEIALQKELKLKSSIDSLSQKVDQLQLDIDILTTKRKSLDDDFKRSYKERLEDLFRKESEVQNKLADADKIFQKAMTKEAKMEDEININKKEHVALIAHLDSEIDRYNKLCDSMDKSIKEHQSIIESAKKSENKIKTLSDEIDKKKISLVDMQIKNAKAERNLDLFSKVLEKKERVIREKEKHLEASQSTVNMKSKTLDYLIQDARTNKKRSEKELSALKKERKEAKVMFDKAKSQEESNKVWYRRLAAVQNRLEKEEERIKTEKKWLTGKVKL